MLKKISKLFLGLVVCAGSACVTPTHASSASAVVITHVQAASSVSAKEEFIALYNTTPDALDITNWCLANKSSVRFACFNSNDQQSYYLPAYSFATIASDVFATNRALEASSLSLVFAPTNQSSGSLVNSTDTLSLYNAQGSLVDSYQWATAMPADKVAMRATHPGQDPYALYDFSSTWSYQTLVTMPPSQIVIHKNAIPEEVPDMDPEPEAVETDITHPRINEILPNPVGSDIGGEFIELYNPSPTDSIDLSKYSIRVGKNLEKTHIFPAGATIPAQGYMTFYDNELGFTLLNSTSQVRLQYKAEPVGDTIIYANPKDGESWAYLEASWQYTNIPTPGAENVVSSVTIAKDDVLTLEKPCPSGQYRNPETNRCRLIATSATPVTSCKEGYYRNTETNRCRLIVAKTNTPAPCKEGQQRNLETNRCRTVAKMTNATHDVKDVSTSKEGIRWYFWLGIGGVVLAVLSYAVWEWRYELKALLRKCQGLFARNRA